MIAMRAFVVASAFLLSGSQCTREEPRDCCCVNDATGAHTMSTVSECNRQCAAAAFCSSSGGMARVDLAAPLRLSSLAGMRFKLESFDSLASTSPPPPIQVTLDQCVSNCKGAASDPFYCFAGTLALPTAHGKGFRTIQKRIDSGGSSFTLKKAETLGAFGYNTDPCGRSDTQVTNNEFTNAGAECVADLGCDDWDDATSTCRSQQDHTMELYIPKVVKGLLSKDKGAEIVSFTTPSAAPTMTIDSDDADDAEWGGRVVGIHSKNDVIIVAFPRSCARVTY